MSSRIQRTRGQTPAEIVKRLDNALSTLQRGRDDTEMEKAEIDFIRETNVIKGILFSEQGEYQQIAVEIFDCNLIAKLIRNMSLIEFETRKDIVKIICKLITKENTSGLEYVENHVDIIFTLFKGYEYPDIATNCGKVLREFIKCESLAKILLYSPEFFNFFNYVKVANFDCASDAFTSLRVLLTSHTKISAPFIERNYNQFFDEYSKLLETPNYVTRRLSTKLLGDLMSNRDYFHVTTRFINQPNNLKLTMNLLKEKSKSIQIEAFHIFKVFISNPTKTKSILHILQQNQSRLVTFMNNFLNDKEVEDEQFKEEKTYLIMQIKSL